MNATAVRAHQPQERDAWLDAGHRAWDDWLAAHGGTAVLAHVGSRAPLKEIEVNAVYDGAVGCCQRCGNSFVSAWRGRSPAACYAKMGAASGAMAEWIREQLVAGTDVALARAEEATAKAEHRRKGARISYEHQRSEVERLTAAYEAEARSDAEHRAHEAADLTVAGALKAVLNRKNRDYVEDLNQRIGAAPSADRPWYALAALQSMRDLSEMMGTA